MSDDVARLTTREASEGGDVARAALATGAGVGFTPGPWRLHDMERATIVAGRPGGEVANCCNGFGDQDANARLIAAAPDLLDALGGLLMICTTPSHPYAEKARAAIAKVGIE